MIEKTNIQRHHQFARKSFRAACAAGLISLLANGAVLAAPFVEGGLAFNSLDGSTAEVTGCDGACGTTKNIPATASGLNVIQVAEGAFINQGGITSITLPEGLLVINGDAFRATNISSITIPSTVTELKFDVFFNVNLNTAVFLGNRPTLNADTFTNTTLTTVCYSAGTTGWPGAAISNGTNSVTPTDCSAPPTPATPVPVMPIWLLGILAGLLSVLGLKKLRKA